MEVSTNSQPGHFCPRERTPEVHWVGGWVDPRAGLEVMEKRNISSSFYWASVVNAPNVLQPYWLIVLHLDFPDLTASLLLWDSSGQRWRCLWTFLFSNVPTSATSRLQEIITAKGGTTWARNGRWILPENARLPRNIQGSFTCRKSTTWDRRLYFASEGRRAEDFSPWKIQWLRSGLNPRTWVPKANIPLHLRWLS